MVKKVVGYGKKICSIIRKSIFENEWKKQNIWLLMQPHKRIWGDGRKYTEITIVVDASDFFLTSFSKFV